MILQPLCSRARFNRAGTIANKAGRVSPLAEPIAHRYPGEAMCEKCGRNSFADRTPLSALFFGFLKVSLCGFGGGLIWARRLVVEQRQWMGEQEFAETLTLCQLMPGAATSALATFETPCLMYYLSYRLWDRFRDMPWQRIVQIGRASCRQRLQF